MSNSTSWFKMYRKIRTSDLLQHHKALAVFIFLLTRVRLTDGVIGTTPVKAGQAFSSWKDIAEHTDLTRQEVRTAVKYLISTNRITATATNRFTVFTIVKWDEFQNSTDLQPPKQPHVQPSGNQQATNKQPPSNHIDRSIEHKKDRMGVYADTPYPEILKELKSENPPSIKLATIAIYASHDAFATVPEFSITNELQSVDSSRWVPAIEKLASTFAGAKLDLPMAPLKKYLHEQTSTKDPELEKYL